jgi:hypothetical protein
MTAADQARGAAVYRITWVPGSDLLVGTCHCGAQDTAEEPVLLWHWLLAHPDHPGAGGGQR